MKQRKHTPRPHAIDDRALAQIVGGGPSDPQPWIVVGIGPAISGEGQPWIVVGTIPRLLVPEPSPW